MFSIRSIRITGFLLMSLITVSCVKGTSTLTGQFSKLPAPKIEMLNSLPAAVKGGSILSFQFRSEAQSIHGVKTQFVDLSLDGGQTFTAVATLDGAATSYDLQVPVVDVTEAIIQIRATDNLGYESKNLSSVFEIISKKPLLTQDVSPALVANNATSINYGGSCVNGLVVKVERIDVSGASVVAAEIPCSAARWAYTAALSIDGRFVFRFTENDIVFNETEVRAVWDRDSTAPLIAAASLRLNGGVPTASFNYLFVDMDAADSAGNVTDFCLKYTTDGASAPGLPAGDDSCWVAVNNPEQPNLRVGRTLTLRQFRYRIGFTPGTYYVDAWVRDSSSNVSMRVRASIQYIPGVPPVVVNVMATRSAIPVLPLAAADTTLAMNAPLYIRWKIESAVNRLGPTPVAIYSTVDDINFVQIASNVENRANGCDLAGTLSTGCFVWPSAFSPATYFRIRVAVTDLNGMITVVSSNFINAAGLNSLAGNTDQGIGGSATASMFLNERSSTFLPDPGSFVVTKDGQVFFRDPERGIYSVSSGDGILKLLLPKVFVVTGFEGRVVPGVTSVADAYQIALDFQNGLLIWDYDRIRRLDLNTMMISTLIGGGTQSADNVEPRAVRMAPNNYYGQKLSALIPLPNGDVLFQSEDYYGGKARLRHFHRLTMRVDSIVVSGRGHYTTHDGSDTEELATCTSNINTTPYPCEFYAFGVEYDRVTSVLTNLQVTVHHSVAGGAYYPLANLRPSGPLRGEAIAPHPPGDLTSYSGYAANRVTGRNGQSYLIGKVGGHISRFDRATNSWVKMVGGTSVGNCVDGTPALTCRIQPTDLFVDVQGNLFFIDRGRIRTLDGNQRVVTVFGQSFFFGDGGLASSARFNIIPGVDRVKDGRIVVTDSVEARLREFQPGGIIQTIAGNGTFDAPSTTELATMSSFHVSEAFNITSVNTDNGDVYAAQSTTGLLRLDRLTGKWVTVSPGLPGSGYPPNVIGFNGTDFLANTCSFSYSLGRVVDVRLTGVSTAGATKDVTTSPKPYNGIDCPDGAPQSACLLGPPYGNYMRRAVWDNVNLRWYTLQSGDSRIVSLGSDSSGVVSTLTALAQVATSFTHVRDAGGAETVYYCAAGSGRLIKRTLATGVEAALEWRVPAMYCSGDSLLYDPIKKSLIFPYHHLGLYGVGEYQL